MELAKTYVDAANLFFEPGFANFKREKTLASMLIPKSLAKNEMTKAVTEYVTLNPSLAEMDLRRLALHVNGYSPDELTPEVVKKKFKLMASIFFKSGFSMIQKKYKWAMGFVKDSNDMENRMLEGIEWFVDTDFEIAKAKLLSLRSLLQLRMQDGIQKN